MSEWHAQISLDGHERVLVIDADSAAGAVLQLRRHWAAGAADRTLVRSYRMAGGDVIHVRWGRLVLAELGPVTPAPV